MVDHRDHEKDIEIRLKELNLGANGLVGTIPKELGGLPYLTLMNRSKFSLKHIIMMMMDLVLHDQCHIIL
jgi:hypothetical protein